MTHLDLVYAPDPVLKEVAQPVENIDEAIRRQMDDMLETMYDGSGIGLAANQVGMLNRILVMDIAGAQTEFADEGKGIARLHVNRPGEDVKEPVIMANPEIVWKSDERSVYEEGCLSIPGHYGDVERPRTVRVKYVDYHGKEQELEAEGLLSHCVQHEIDHLDGVLFIDYISRIKRDMIIRKMKKYKKDVGIM